MAQDKVKFTTPVGRLISNGIYTPRTTDSDNNPLVYKTGADAGKPRVEYYAGIAIPKDGRDWKQTEWGAVLVAEARRHFPSMFDPATGNIWQGRDFAWKVQDGDSQVPNTKGNRNCDREGWPGHWILFASNGFAPSCWNRDGTAPLMENIIEAGHYVQLRCSVGGNGSTQSPGLFINLDMVAHSAYGPVIVSRESGTEAGFGAAPLPQGASATPIGGMATGATPAPQPAAAAPQPPVAAPAPVPTPAHDLVQPGAVGIAPPAPPAPPAPVAEEAYIVNGQRFTKSQLVASGYTDAHFVTLQRA